VDIKVAVDLLMSLDSFDNNLHNRYVEYEEQDRQLSGNENYKTTLHRKRKCNTRFDSDVGNADAEGVVLTDVIH